MVYHILLLFVTNKAIGKTVDSGVEAYGPSLVITFLVEINPF